MIIKRNVVFLGLFALLFVPAVSFAHQPRIVESETVQVVDPEISKAYYATLSGEPHTYTINAEEEFDLYVGILVPDTSEPVKDVTAQVIKGDELLATLGGEDAEWTTFFEPFGQSTYWDGGEYKARAEAGDYRIVVSSTNNDSKYSLAVGEIEAFDRVEGANALTLIPELKRDFFDESPISFIRSPFGWGLIVVMYVLAFIVGFAYRFIVRMFARSSARKAGKNINKTGRALRFAISLALLLWAISTSWSPLTIFISGLVMFESIFSWCGVNHLLGRNTCDA